MARNGPGRAARPDGEPPEPQRGSFKRWLYRYGILVTPQQQARLRNLTVHERLLETRIQQLLPAIPMVLLLGALYNGWIGVQYAAIISVVVLIGLTLYQRVSDDRTGSPGSAGSTGGAGP